MTKEDVELAAMGSIIEALTPLDEEARSRVVEYVFRRLGLPTPDATRPSDALGPDAGANDQHTPSSSPEVAQHMPKPKAAPQDIRSLKEAKQPRSANEMAAVVAYYLAEIVPHGDRKTEIRAADVTKYFKQGGYPLPKAPGQTLINAKNAGYFDPGPKPGSFSLNPVGHNLVVHGLPPEASDSGRPSSSGRTKKRKKAGKKTGKKKRRTGKKAPSGKRK